MSVVIMTADGGVTPKAKPPINLVAIRTDPPERALVERAAAIVDLPAAHLARVALVAYIEQHPDIELSTEDLLVLQAMKSIRRFTVGYEGARRAQFLDRQAGRG